MRWSLNKWHYCWSNNKQLIIFAWPAAFAYQSLCLYTLNYWYFFLQESRTMTFYYRFHSSSNKYYLLSKCRSMCEYRRIVFLLLCLIADKRKQKSIPTSQPFYTFIGEKWTEVCSHSQPEKDDKKWPVKCFGNLHFSNIIVVSHNRMNRMKKKTYYILLLTNRQYTVNILECLLYAVQWTYGKQ